MPFIGILWENEGKVVVQEPVDVPRPIRFFKSNFPSYFLQPIERCGFIKPKLIQSTGWSMAFKGRDLIGIAKTGSGRTLAYLLPTMVHDNA